MATADVIREAALYLEYFLKGVSCRVLVFVCKQGVKAGDKPPRVMTLAVSSG